MRVRQSPECRWISFVDAEGRRRLEMRWQPAAPVAQIQAPASARARAA